MDDGSTEFEIVMEAFTAGVRRGDDVAIDDFAERYPAHAEEIRRLFPIVQMMERKKQRGIQQDDLSESGLMEAELKLLDDAKPVKRLGDYRILREIGRGGMGIVYEAQQESLGRRVALKLLPEVAQLDERRKLRFQQEAQAAAMLHHTNIVPVFGVGSEDGVPYMVMQFIDGQPIDNVISELSRIRSKGLSSNEKELTTTENYLNVSTIAESMERVEAWGTTSNESSSGSGLKKSGTESFSSTSLSESKTNSIYFRNVAKAGVQMFQALGYAHSKGLLHRDIKPANLLVDQAGSVWVTDFGLAKSVESPDLTRTGEVVGTLRYMSPEQLEGNATDSSDLFAMGLTLYEMVSLRPAYDSREKSQLIQQVMNASPARLGSVDRDIPRDLETIVHKCIAAEPASRYGSAIEVAEDLQRFLDGESVLARRASLVDRSIKWCRRRPVVASLLLALAVSLLGGIATTTWQWRKSIAALELAEQNLVEANEQRAIAKKHFQQARQSVDRFFTVVSNQRLLREPGLQPLKRELLNEALDYHREFVKQYGDDPGAKEDLANSLFSIIEIEGVVSPGAHLVEAVDEPIRILKELADSEPETARHVERLAQAMTLKAQMSRRMDIDKSIKTTLQAIKVVEDFRAGVSEDNLAGLRELAKLHQFLGLTYESIDQAQQRTDRMHAHYSKAMLLLTQLNLEYPDDAFVGQSLALAHRDLGIAYRKMDEVDKSVASYEKAMSIIGDVIDANPGNPVVRRTSASICNTIGFFYSNVQSHLDYDKSLQFYEESAKQYETLSKMDPLVIEYQDGFARARLNAGGVLQVMGKLDLSLKYREEATEVCEKLSKAYPELLNLKSGWAMALDGVGTILRQMDRVDESVEKHKLAFEIHSEVVEKDPRQSVARRRLLQCLQQTARAYSSGRSFEEAMEAIDSIENYIDPASSAPRFTQGREFMFIACKIGSLMRDEEVENDPEWETLREKALNESKAKLQSAFDSGFNVLMAWRQDTGVAGFQVDAECKQIQEWVEAELSK
jgi:serine/threonine-protein kinase